MRSYKCCPVVMLTRSVVSLRFSEAYFHVWVQGVTGYRTHEAGRVLQPPCRVRLQDTAALQHLEADPADWNGQPEREHTE